MLKMDLEYNQGILFVRLNGVLNRKSNYKINCYLNPILQKHQIKYLVYNLNSLSDIDESGIDSIINSKLEIKKIKGKILFCNVNERINKKIRSLRIKKIANEKNALNLIEV